MSRRQTVSKKQNSVNSHTDSLNNLNKHDALFSSNNSNENILHILNMYGNELHNSYDEPSEVSRVKSTNYLRYKTEHTSENTYLNSVAPSNDVAITRNNNIIQKSNNSVYCYNPFMCSKNYSSDNSNYSRHLNSLVNNDVLNSFYTDNKESVYSNKESNLVGIDNTHEGCTEYINIGTNITQNSEEGTKNCNKFNGVMKNINNELHCFYKNASSCINRCSNVTESSIDNLNTNKLFNNDDLYEKMNSDVIKKEEDFLTNHINVKEGNHLINHTNNITNNDKFTNSTESCKTISIKDLNESSLDNDRIYNSPYLNSKIKIDKTCNIHYDLQHINNSIIKEVPCSYESKVNNILISEPKNSNENICLKGEIKKYSSEQENKEEKKITTTITTTTTTTTNNFNKTLKSYSLDDIRNGKVEIPSIIFKKLPFTSKSDNAINVYEKNKKLMKFMNDCNNSVNIILKYPQIEKGENKTFKIPCKYSPEISKNIGSSIVYEDNFDRENYHPNVQNLHAKRKFENHVFSMLKNKNDLGKKLFTTYNKRGKCNYDNGNGFWMSNVDKNRLVNPEKNDSYVTELVYEKNDTYENEMDELKTYKNYEDIPPLEDLYENNNFYYFLRNEKMYYGHAEPVISTIMRRYDVDEVLDYNHVETTDDIVPVYVS